jgi:type IV pilus assembly protein PilA
MNKKSKKGFTLVEIMIVVVIIGLLATMAIPAFQKVRETAQEKKILNNLRLFNTAAQQYMLDTGQTIATYGNASIVNTVVGDGYMRPFEQVATEDYSGLSVETNTTQLTIAGPNGTITYSF